MTERNPQTVEEARGFVAHVESLFMPWNIPALLAGFTEDCVVRFGDLPEFRGNIAFARNCGPSRAIGSPITGKVNGGMR